MLSAGLVGLPNVGKSTLFNAITNSQALVANYPFATIKPNIAFCAVRDERLDKIAAIFNPKKITPTTLQLHDIPGLVAGASKGEGLGNQFLTNIRNTDAICQVVRCFDDKDVSHINKKVDPVADFSTIELELILADYEMVSKRLERLQKKAKASNNKQQQLEITLLKKIHQHLEDFVPLRSLEFSAEASNIIKDLNFLTIKPIVIIANVNENDLFDGGVNNDHLTQLKAFAASKNIAVIVICAKIENEIAKLPYQQKQEFLKMFNITKQGVDQIIFTTYKLLRLATFFTAGKEEVKAWTFNQGMLAPECAGKIHSDIQRGFIRVEVYHYDDLIACNSEKKVKETGKLRIEGKNYLVADGDICYFRFNV